MKHAGKIGYGLGVLAALTLIFGAVTIVVWGIIVIAAHSLEAAAGVVVLAMYTIQLLAFYAEINQLKRKIAKLERENQMLEAARAALARWG